MGIVLFASEERLNEIAIKPVPWVNRPAPNKNRIMAVISRYGIGTVLNAVTAYSSKELERRLRESDPTAENWKKFLAFLTQAAWWFKNKLDDVEDL